MNEHKKASGELNCVSVIIPHYNDSIRLAICLEALNKQKLPPQTNLQIIVADNGSDSAPFDICKDIENTELVVETTPGSYAARNTALKHASGELIAFTDSDCIPQNDWILNAFNYFNQHRDAHLLSGKVEVFTSAHPSLFERYDQLLAFPQEWYAKHDHFGVTANLFVKKHVFESIGDFNASLLSGGDMEWGQRAYHQGYKLNYLDDVIVLHPARKTWKSLTRKINRIAGGHIKAQSPSDTIEKLLFVLPHFPVKRQLAPIIKSNYLTTLTKIKLVSLVVSLAFVQSYYRAKQLSGANAVRT